MAEVVRVPVEKEMVVVTQCTSRRCGTRREIAAGEVPEGEHPCCEKCGMPMVAMKAVWRKKPEAR